jgi:1-acyl-sn-glycerol-3-phosphate acyltransferase
VNSPSHDLERTLARLSADEIVEALRLARAPAAVRRLVRASFSTISAPLGRVLARFDADIDAVGIGAAAARALERLGATVTVKGAPAPVRGPMLIVSNHPGAYDALALLAALGRDDIVAIAADRVFLRAMPSLARHLVFVPEPPVGRPDERAVGVRRALRHIARGGALLHFGAGRIEPDPAFAGVDGGEPLEPWRAGTGLLVRAAAKAGAAVVPAVVAGVHSPRAKRLALTRLAERGGVTTLAPLLQVAVPRYRDVTATVHLGAVTPAADLAATGDDDTGVTARVRRLALDLIDAPLQR